ncbi:MAG: class I SAM-dependent methyltransferase, partial [Dermatophilaceae bacterium]
ASELTRLGHHATGVDADPDLVALAREDVRTRFLVADLATLDLRTDQEFQVALMAGNVVNYLTDGTLGVVLSRLAAHLAPGGHLVAGFRLGADLPEGAAPVDLLRYDRLADATGLAYITRYATWARDPFLPGGDYAVSVHRRRSD